MPYDLPPNKLNQQATPYDIEPIHVDDRGYSFHDVFNGCPIETGQINISIIDMGVVKAWHRHKHQTDYWFCPYGKLLVCVSNGLNFKTQIHRIILSPLRPKILIIPKGLWHGCKALAPNSVLLYGIDKKYNSNNPDEERKNWDHINGCWDINFK